MFNDDPYALSSAQNDQAGTTPISFKSSLLVINNNNNHHEQQKNAVNISDSLPHENALTVQQQSQPDYPTDVTAYNGNHQLTLNSAIGHDSQDFPRANYGMFDRESEAMNNQQC